MDLWYSEVDDKQTVRQSYAVEEVLFRGRSEYQTVDVIKTKAYGNMLLLDGLVMLTDMDEFVYHEMIAHVPALVHPNPKRVLVIGGGDGGTVRELLRHPGIEEIILCEIDQLVIDVSRKFFPAVAGKLDDPRVKVKVGDGIAFVKTLRDELDILIVDSTDPIGPGEGLFTREFYQDAARALRSGGVIAAQTESPWYPPEVLARIFRNIGAGFKYIHPYIGSIPTYPRGLWSWTLATNVPELKPQQFAQARLAKLAPNLQYVTEATFAAAFTLPAFYRSKLHI